MDEETPGTVVIPSREDGEESGQGNPHPESSRSAALGMTSPSLRDLVTILYRPRETMRRILDSGRPRWTWEVIVLASVCSSFIDPDIRRASALLTPMTQVAVALFGIIVNAVGWVLLSYLFAWIATIVGRRLDGEGTVRDMRTAIAWALVPHIWSIVFRVPGSIYLSRFARPSTDEVHILMEFVRQGGCSVIVVLLTIQVLLYALILYVSSNTVAEALRFSSWRGLATIAITSVIPIVIGVAAFIATRT